MKVGVLGSADVGQTLSKGFQRHGHEVQIGTRNPAKLAEFTAATGIPAGTLSDVAHWAELVVLSIHGSAAEAAVQDLAGALARKVVIDTTNPLSDAAPVDGVLQSYLGPNESQLERLQARVPSAKFVKAFNSVGSERMVNPAFAGGPPTMFFCGSDAGARETVRNILVQFGWEPCDMGTAVAARAIEPLAMLWCIPGFLRDSWTHAFKVLWQ